MPANLTILCSHRRIQISQLHRQVPWLKIDMLYISGWERIRPYSIWAKP